MILLAALAGGLIMTGLVLVIRELRRRAPAPGTPPAWNARAAGLIGKDRRHVLLSMAAGLLVFAVTRWPVAGLAAAGAVLFLPKITSTRQARRRIEVLEGLEQWTRRLADLLTASRGLEDALDASARSAPAAIAVPVTTLSRRLASRARTEDALREFAAGIGDPAGDRIAAALIIATGHRGAAVRNVLASLAELLARDVAARREIEAERAQHRTTLKWITAFIVGFTAFAVLNHAYSAPYGTPPGQAVLALVACLYAAGLIWLNRLSAIPGPGRFLAVNPAVREARPQAGASR
jgi:Flp pilus assembly protein TadB